MLGTERSDASEGTKWKSVQTIFGKRAGGSAAAARAVGRGMYQIILNFIIATGWREESEKSGEEK